MSRNRAAIPFFFVLSLLVSACASDGARGKEGPPGNPAIDEGIIGGSVASSIGGVATGITVSTVPDAGTTTTGVDGTFALTVPVGVYTVRFTSPDYTETEVTGVSVIGGGTASLAVTLERINPLLAASRVIYQTGFEKPVTLGAEVTGATGPVTWTWEQIAGPTAVTLAGADTAAPTFTTATFDEILSAVELELDPRSGMVGIDHDQLAEMTWRFRAKVSDGTFATTAQVDVQPAAVTGLRGTTIPRGVLLIANVKEAASYDWMLSAPATSTAVLEGSTTRNPWLIPDALGTYTLTNLATDPDTVISYRADDWLGAACTGCHATNATEWSQTGHATMLQRGLDGEIGSYYSEECISCHTVGFDRGADNGGFDDVMEDLGWEFPEIGPGAYESLPNALEVLSNIACESCHGPGKTHPTNPLSIGMGATFAAEACGTCHQEEPYHDLYSQYKTSGHANLELAMDESSVETRGTTAAHCGRCHSAQGFARWSVQMLGGNSGNITKPDGTAADLPYLQGLGLTQAEVEGVTCVACHDPHTLELRVPPSASFTTPAGYTVAGMGKGALCISCHNTRNGLRDDAHPPTSYSAPHVAAQGDVFMGRNAYFVSGIQISDHAAIGETCVTCHVELVPDSIDTMGVNHTFKPDRSICGTCHGPGVTGEMLSLTMEEALEDVAAEAAAGVRDLIALRVTAGLQYRVRAWDPVTDLYSSSSSSNSNVLLSETPTLVTMVEVHGQAGFTFTLPTPVTITWTDASQTTTNEVSFQIGSLKDTAAPTPQTLVPVDSVLVKALWNYFLLEGDASGGIHNPEFAFQVIDATEAELQVWRASLQP